MVITQVCDKGYRLPRPERIVIPDSLWNLMQKSWIADPAERPSFDQIYEELCGIESDVIGKAPINNVNIQPTSYRTQYSSNQATYEAQSSVAPTAQTAYSNRREYQNTSQTMYGNEQ